MWHVVLPTFISRGRQTRVLFLGTCPPYSRGPAPDFFFRDFDAPGPLMADTSASTIAASGLLLLADLEEGLTPPNYAGASKWRQSALKLLNAATDLAWRPSWQSLLSNGTVNNPANNNLTGTIYGAPFTLFSGDQKINRILGDYHYVKVILMAIYKVRMP